MLLSIFACVHVASATPALGERPTVQVPELGGERADAVSMFRELAAQGEPGAVEMLELLGDIPPPADPVPFPADLPEVYGPAAFEHEVHTALEACALDGLRLVSIDCGEYPCLARFEVTSGNQQLTGCRSWKQAYGRRGSPKASGMIRVGDEDRPYLVTGVWPPGGPDDGETKRLRLRFDQARAELTEAWGGRELSEEELEERSRAFWRSQAEQGDEGARRMLEMLEAR